MRSSVAAVDVSMISFPSSRERGEGENIIVAKAFAKLARMR